MAWNRPEGEAGRLEGLLLFGRHSKTRPLKLSQCLSACTNSTSWEGGRLTSLKVGGRLSLRLTGLRRAGQEGRQEGGRGGQEDSGGACQAFWQSWAW